ncbi:GNAT family N-acetyltransferase [Halorussus gelatinilyticus]|uniref:GNAT family N-acetyltransferase n=1 Tax=Halorussus gelatinilyticus TaxID=2937524 RepID=A0A8U0IPG9_9EURY|nr:N-acetyltransferase [Halorussus gelatinilyticus]UPW02362.1 GNAT family N-acetyltransferase [Halorussus gelatinilyticus]
MELRPYDPDRDPRDLWDLKRAFELGLGSGTGDDDKQDVYEGKLTDEYGERYLDWVFWCTKHDPRCVTVAEIVGDEPDAAESGDDTGDARATAEASDGHSLAGYVFVLPQQLAMIWDAAVLNEIYVRPEYRGSGVADDLMDAAVALAEDQDLPLDRLVLDVDRENDRAQAFYDRHGFEHWGEMVARKLE